MVKISMALKFVHLVFAAVLDLPSDLLEFDYIRLRMLGRWCEALWGALSLL